MTTTQNSTTTYEVGTIVHVNPSDLLTDKNIREAKPSKDLIASVKDLGVLVAITAVLTTDNQLRVRMGERRTLAAIEAGRDTVPVYVTATEDDNDVDRIVRQRDENTHRDGLTTAEEIGVVEQLAAFGLSAAQIAKKARIKRADVDQALTVSQSKLAKKATERYADLTLDQAAAVAEFSVISTRRCSELPQDEGVA